MDKQLEEEVQTHTNTPAPIFIYTSMLMSLSYIKANNNDIFAHGIGRLNIYS